MERAPGSTAKGKERALLLAARHTHHFSQEEVAAKIGVSKATVHRWEKEGDIPQPFHLRELCKLYEKTALELGFTMQEPELEEGAVGVRVANEGGKPEEEQESTLNTFRQHFLLSCFMRRIWDWPPGDVRYQRLQELLLLELEDKSMHDDMSRRDALRFLALVPADMLGLSAFRAVFTKGFSAEDILKHCAAGVTACWQLRRGKDLSFAHLAVSTYVPTLKALAHHSPEAQRKASADLLAQCFLLKSTLSRHVDASNEAVAYAQQAEIYGEQAGSLLLRVLALRTQASSHSYANHWIPALQAAEKATYLLEERDKRDQRKHASVFSPSEEAIPLLVCSYVYAGLATYQARNGYKEQALLSLMQAHDTFSDERAPIWIDHNQANLALNEGMTHYHLGLYKEALDSFTQTRHIRQDELGRAEILIDEVMTEVSRDDQPRDMQWCIDHWVQGIQGARELQSQQRINEALQAYTALCAAWPGEKQVRDLRAYLVQ